MRARTSPSCIVDDRHSGRLSLRGLARRVALRCRSRPENGRRRKQGRARESQEGHLRDPRQMVPSAGLYPRPERRHRGSPPLLAQGHPRGLAGDVRPLRLLQGKEPLAQDSRRARPRPPAPPVISLRAVARPEAGRREELDPRISRPPGLAALRRPGLPVGLHGPLARFLEALQGRGRGRGQARAIQGRKATVSRLVQVGHRRHPGPYAPAAVRIEDQPRLDPRRGGAAPPRGRPARGRLEAGRAHRDISQGAA